MHAQVGHGHRRRCGCRCRRPQTVNQKLEGICLDLEQKAAANEELAQRLQRELRVGWGSRGSREPGGSQVEGRLRGRPLARTAIGAAPPPCAALQWACWCWQGIAWCAARGDIVLVWGASARALSHAAACWRTLGLGPLACTPPPPRRPRLCVQESQAAIAELEGQLQAAARAAPQQQMRVRGAEVAGCRAGRGQGGAEGTAGRLKPRPPAAEPAARPSASRQRRPPCTPARHLGGCAPRAPARPSRLPRGALGGALAAAGGSLLGSCRGSGGAAARAGAARCGMAWARPAWRRKPALPKPCGRPCWGRPACLALAHGGGDPRPPSMPSPCLAHPLRLPCLRPRPAAPGALCVLPLVCGGLSAPPRITTTALHSWRRRPPAPGQRRPRGRRLPRRPQRRLRSRPRFRSCRPRTRGWPRRRPPWSTSWRTNGLRWTRCMLSVCVCVCLQGACAGGGWGPGRQGRHGAC